VPAPVVVKFSTAGAKEVEAVFASLAKKLNDFSRSQVASATRAARASTKAMTTGATKQITVGDSGAKRAADMQIREAARAAKEIARIKRKQADVQIREATRAANAEVRAAAAARRAQEQEFNKLGARGRAAGRTVAGGLRSAVGSVTGTAAMLGAAGGVAMVGAGIRSGYMLNRRAVLLSNATQMPGVTARTSEELLSAASGIARRTGVGAEDIMGAMENVSARAGGAVGLGKLLGDLEELTKLSVAAGVSMEDMGGVVAAAFNAGVQPGDDIQSLVRSLIAQGKAGAIEFRDFADELGRLGGAGSKWGSGTRMLQEAGGFAQIAAQTAIGPEQSRTVVIDMLREFSQAAKIKSMSQMGVQVTNASGMLNNPAELMAGIIDAVEKGKAPANMARQLAGLSGANKQSAIYGQLFTGRSGEIAQTLRMAYKQGYTGQYGEMAGKTYTGAAAVRAKIEEASRPFEMTKEQAAKEYDAVAKTMELARAEQEFKAKMIELLPEFSKLIPQLVKVSDGFARLVVWLGKNPLEGLGAIMGIAFTRELAVAGMNKTIEAGFQNIFTSVIGGKGSGGVLGALGALGTITLAAGVVYLAGKTVIDEAFKAGGEAGKKAFALEMQTMGTQSAAERLIKSGEATPEQLATLVPKLEQEAAAAREAAGGMGMPTTVGGAAALAMNPLGSYEILKRLTSEQEGTSKENMEAAAAKNEELIAALGKLSVTISAAQFVGPTQLAEPTNAARTQPASMGPLR